MGTPEHEALRQEIQEHASRLAALEAGAVADRASLADVRATLGRLAADLNELFALLRQHAAEESLQITAQTGQIERLSRRILWAGTVGLLLIAALSHWLPEGWIAHVVSLLAKS